MRISTISRAAWTSLVLTGFVFTTPASSVAVEPIPIADYKQSEDVNFEKQVLPILRRKCLACHNSTDAEGDLVLESPQSIAETSEEAVIPGKSAESRLMQVASHQDEPEMPPKDNKVGAKNLTSEELGLVKLWIDQGAKGEVTGLAEKIEWQPLPPGVIPIYTVAVSEDGQYAAAGRANQIFIYHLPSKREIGRLTDPELLKTGAYSKPGVAHLDLVQSLAFHPSGDLLASGGYRTVKLWRRLRDTKQAELAGLDAKARSVAASADGKRLAVGQENGAIKVFDIPSGKMLNSLTGHEGPVTGVCFARDGRLISGGQDKTFRIWNVDEAKEMAAAVATPAAVNAVALVGDEKWIATGGADNQIRTWQLGAEKAEGEDAVKPVKEFSGSGGPITSLAALGPQGAQFVSGGKDGTIRIWDAQGGNQIRQMSHGAPVECVAASPDAKRLASVSSNNTMKLWNAENGQPIAENKGDFRAGLRVEALNRAVELAKKQVGLNQKDLEEAKKRQKSEEENAKKAEETRKKAEEEMAKKVEAAKKPVADKEAAEKKLAETTAAKEKAEAEQKAEQTKLAGAEQTVKSAQAALDQSNKELADATQAANQAAQEFQKAQEAAKKEADNQTLSEAAAKAEKASQQALEKQKQAEAKKAAAEKAVADATQALTASQEKKKEIDKSINDLENQRKKTEAEVKKLAGPAQKAVDEKNAAERAFQAAERSVKRAAEVVKLATEDVPVVQAVVDKSQELQKQQEEALEASKKALAENEKPMWGVAFSSDGATVAAVGEGQKVQTYDAATGAALDTYSGQNANLTLVSYAGDNQIVSIGADNSLVVWKDGNTWQLERVVGGVEKKDLADRVIALDFSSNGEMLATGSGEPSRTGEIKIWKVADGTLIREVPEPHSDTVFGLEFSPDDTQIISCAADRFIKLFNVADGKFLRSFEGHTHHVLGVSWSADGRTIASSGADKVIKVWDVRTGDQKKTIAGFNKEVTSIRFIANGDEMVVSCGDKSVQMKRADGGNIRSLPGGADFMYSVGVSGDGSMIVAGGQDSVVRVWANNGQSFATFEASEQKKE